MIHHDKEQIELQGGATAHNHDAAQGCSWVATDTLSYCQRYGVSNLMAFNRAAGGGGPRLIVEAATACQLMCGLCDDSHSVEVPHEDLENTPEKIEKTLEPTSQPQTATPTSLSPTFNPTNSPSRMPFLWLQQQCRVETRLLSRQPPCLHARLHARRLRKHQRGQLYHRALFQQISRRQLQMLKSPINAHQLPGAMHTATKFCHIKLQLRLAMWTAQR